MPNHVTNELTASKDVLDALANGEAAIDFNRVVPMPAGMEVECSLVVTDWAEVLNGQGKPAELMAKVDAYGRMDRKQAFDDGDFGSLSDGLHAHNTLRMLQEGPFLKDLGDAQFESLIQCLRNIRSTGHANWYTWSQEFWGTKWNAYETRRVDENRVRFDTAWSMPTAFFDALTRKYPDETFRIRWADEDSGNNAGNLVAKNGEIVEGGPFDNGSPLAWQTWRDLKHDGQPPDYYRKTDSGAYEYVESLDR